MKAFSATLIGAGGIFIITGIILETGPATSRPDQTVAPGAAFSVQAGSVRMQFYAPAGTVLIATDHGTLEKYTPPPCPAAP